KHPSEGLKKGEQVETVHLNIDTENHRRSLSIKQLQPDIWDQFFASRAPGSTVKGKIVRHAPFGIFVEIEEGIEGLCHISEFEDSDSKAKIEDRFAIGDTLDFKIIKMSPADHKIGLSQRATSAEGERREYDSYREAAEGGAERADLFQAKNNT